MITDEQQLDQALEQMGRMYHALFTLRAEVLPQSQQWFAIMAEGPLDELRKLERDVCAYLYRMYAQ